MAWLNEYITCISLSWLFICHFIQYRNEYVDCRLILVTDFNFLFCNVINFAFWHGYFMWKCSNLCSWITVILFSKYLILRANNIVIKAPLYNVQLISSEKTLFVLAKLFTYLNIFIKFKYTWIIMKQIIIDKFLSVHKLYSMYYNYYTTYTP